MKARQNQPESTPRGSFRCTPVECSATTVVDARRKIRVATSVPRGVWPCSLSEKLPVISGIPWSGKPERLHVPHARRISPLKSRL